MDNIEARTGLTMKLEEPLRMAEDERQMEKVRPSFGSRTANNNKTNSNF
jgi:hypothetical protein